MRSVLSSLVTLVVLAACSGSDDADDSKPTDAAVSKDSGTKKDAAADASSGKDAGSSDAAIDDATATSDASTEDGAAEDASIVDAAVDSGGPVGSAGCGKSATSGATKKTIHVGTLDRTYILSIPTGYNPDKPLPLLFAWHGRTGSASGFRSNGTSYGGGVEKAAAGKAIFVYPDGLPVTSDPSDTGWIDTDPNSRDFQLFDALLAKISNDLCVDPKRVFSYGHSFGAFMSEGLGCHRGDVLRGIGPVAGGPPYKSSTCTGGPLAVWIENSTDDPIVDFTTRGIPARDYWIKTNGCDATKTSPVEPSPCVAYQGCAAGAPLHWCAPTTAGHAFPSFAYAGIWNFFASL